MRLLFLFVLCAPLFVASAQDARTEGAARSREFVMGKDTMKTYFFVLLTKGPNRTQDSATAADIQKGHMANIQRLADAGTLIVAGPFADGGDWRGIFIFDVETKEEAEALVKSDPAIQSGRLAYEIHPWLTAKGTRFK